MAKQVFVLTGLLVVLMAAGRAGMYAGSSFDGPIIPMPLAEASGPHPDLVSKTQTPAADSSKASTAATATGERVSTLVMPGTAFRVVHLFQYDSNSARPEAIRATDKPLSVIVWKALDVGAKVNVRDLRERISETSASPSMTGKAVYVLLSDYRLQKLALSNPDIEHVLDLLRAGDGEALASDAVWKAKVSKELKEVEWLDDGSHKSKKNKDKKAGKDKAGKAGKLAKNDKAEKAKPSKATKSTTASVRGKKASRA